MASPAPLAPPATFDYAATLQPAIPQPNSKLTTIDLIGGIKCHICHITFGNKKDFDGHYVNHNTGSPSIVYMCVVCHKEIAGYPSFRNHCYLNHVAKDRFKCKECSKTFSKHSVLQLHIDTIHKFACATCNQQFPSKKELQMHQFTHKQESEGPPYDCHTCQQPIQTADCCEQHIEDHCTLTYSCPICNEAIPDMSAAADHLTTHFSDSTEPIIESDIDITEDSSIDLLGGILCHICDSTYKTRIEFDVHFVEQHSNKNIIYSCNICKKQYDKYLPFGNHCYYHYTKNRFECDECDKSFPRLSLLVRHTAMFHPEGAAGGGGGAKPYACARCGHAYGSERRLGQHLRDQHAVSTLHCTQRGCSMLFDTPKDLIYHQAIHKSANRCQYCGLQFTSLAACERHIPIHRKKQYSCPVCERNYAEKYLVMKHVQQHFSSVLHLCKICGKIFNAKNRLVQHIKVHSEVRNFKCSYCDKTFVKDYHLNQHLNIHTGMKPFQCTMCPKTFASYPNVSKHMRRMHNVTKHMRRKHNATKVMLEKNVGDSKEPDVLINEVDMKLDNNNVVEDLVDTTSSELGTYTYMESDDSMVESDGIDPVAMEQESQIFEVVRSIEEEIDNVTPLEPVDVGVPEFTELLPGDSHDELLAALSAPALWGPREYGPDFGSDPALADPDDRLPHIDPLLTIKPVYYGGYHYDQPPDVDPYAKWEPIISKVFEADRMTVLNTDIY